MDNITTDNINGVPFWGHGTLENAEASITPEFGTPMTEEESEPVATPEVEEEEVTPNEVEE